MITKLRQRIERNDIRNGNLTDRVIGITIPQLSFVDLDRELNELGEYLLIYTHADFQHRDKTYRISLTDHIKGLKKQERMESYGFLRGRRVTKSDVEEVMNIIEEFGINNSIRCSELSIQNLPGSLKPRKPSQFRLLMFKGSCEVNIDGSSLVIQGLEKSFGNLSVDLTYLGKANFYNGKANSYAWNRFYLSDYSFLDGHELVDNDPLFRQEMNLD